MDKKTNDSYNGFANKSTWAFCMSLLDTNQLHYKLINELGKSTIDDLKRFHSTGSVHLYPSLNYKVFDVLLDIFRAEMVVAKDSLYVLQVLEIAYDEIDFGQIAKEIVNNTGDFLGVFEEEDDEYGNS
jgi:hypothetical protein